MKEISESVPPMARDCGSRGADVGRRRKQTPPECWSVCVCVCVCSEATGIGTGIGLSPWLTTATGCALAPPGPPLHPVRVCGAHPTRGRSRRGGVWGSERPPAGKGRISLEIGGGQLRAQGHEGASYGRPFSSCWRPPCSREAQSPVKRNEAANESTCACVLLACPLTSSSVCSAHT